MFSINIPLSRQLQSKNIDLFLTLQLENDVKLVLKYLRSDGSDGFSNKLWKIQENIK